MAPMQNLTLCNTSCINDNKSEKQSCAFLTLKRMCVSNTETILKVKSHLEKKHIGQIVKEDCPRCFKERS